MMCLHAGGGHKAACETHFSPIMWFWGLNLGHQA